MTPDVAIVRHPRARRMTLRYDPLTDTARLTVPARTSAHAAQALLAQHDGWLEQQRARRPARVPFAPGSVIPFDDARLTIVLQGAARRPVRIGDTLVCGGPADLLAARVARYLRGEALRLLNEDTQLFAARAGVTVASVAVGDARSRWGSCSHSGTIRYNWRLACAPAWVRRATAAHEVGHRLHMNHSAAFHACVRTLLGCDPAPARQWLRINGQSLHALGRAD